MFMFHLLTLDVEDVRLNYFQVHLQSVQSDNELDKSAVICVYWYQSKEELNCYHIVLLIKLFI
jgi:hypothetical protein